MHDVFISHASEDKATIARPLADELRARGFDVWFDEYTLELGDSLRESIDRGLAECRYGVVILSPHFFAKRWPQQELNALFARETADGQKRILPVWHGITHEEVTSYSPILADRLAVPTSGGLQHVVERVSDVLSGRGKRLGHDGRSSKAAPRSAPSAEAQSPRTINMPPGYERRLNQIRFDIARRRDPQSGLPIPPESYPWSEAQQRLKEAGRPVLIPELLPLRNIEMGFIPPRLRIWNFGGGDAHEITMTVEGRRLESGHPLFNSGDDKSTLTSGECSEILLSHGELKTKQVLSVDLEWKDQDEKNNSSSFSLPIPQSN